MFTVSLIGPDGVGKTTIAKEMEASFPLPVKYLYMGINAGSSNYMLPTTRWWKNRNIKRKASEGATKGKDAKTQSSNDLSINLARHRKLAGGQRLITHGRKVVMSIRKSLGFINRILEEGYRQLIAYSYARRGYIVIFDRHFTYDYYHYDLQSQNRDWSSTRKMHGFFVKHMFPKPDLVICLDAPGEVVFQRKGEFSPEVLESKRAQYLRLKTVVKNFIVVNADRKLKLVVQDVSDLIYQFYRNRQDSVRKKQV